MALAPDRRSFLKGSLGALAGVPALASARMRAWEPQRADAYSLDPAICYLNHGSIGTVPRVVREAQAGYLEVCETNPWLYMWGGAWEAGVADARSVAAELLEAAADDVAIVRSTTEAFHVLARGLEIGSGDEVVFSQLNHIGASRCFEHAALERGFTVRRFEIPYEVLPGAGIDELVELHVGAIRDATRVLVLPHVDNIVGVRHPVREIAAAARAKGVEYVLVDGAQAVAAIPVTVGDLGVDAYATSAHKWTQAPKGTGLLWTTNALRDVLRPMFVTWGQDRWKGTVRVLEDFGTRNLPTVLALADAGRFQLELGVTETTARRRALFDAFRDRVDATTGLSWRSPRRFEMGASLFGIHVDHPDVDAVGRRLFSEHGIVVRAFGRGFDHLRVSPNAANTIADVDRFFDALARVRAG